MTDRGRLIELITDYDRTYDCEFCTKAEKGGHCGNECLADYLLDNGVIAPPQKIIPYIHVSKDNNSTYTFVKKHVIYEWNEAVQTFDKDRAEKIFQEWKTEKEELEREQK